MLNTYGKYNLCFRYVVKHEFYLTYDYTTHIKHMFNNCFETQL